MEKQSGKTSAPWHHRTNIRYTMNRIWTVEKNKLFTEPLFFFTCHLIQFNVLWLRCVFFLSFAAARLCNVVCYFFSIFTAHLFYVIIVMAFSYAYFLMIIMCLFVCTIFSWCLLRGPQSDNGAKIEMIIEQPWPDSKKNICTCTGWPFCLWAAKSQNHQTS